MLFWDDYNYYINILVYIYPDKLENGIIHKYMQLYTYIMLNYGQILLHLNKKQ